MSRMPWPDDLKAVLRELWTQRENGRYPSAAEIGRRLGLSRGKVVGQVRRMKLVRADVPPRPPKARPVLLLSTSDGQHESSWFERNFKADEPKMTAIGPEPVVVDKWLRTEARPCCFPIGTPGKRDFRFCDDLAVSGKPYCATHVELAYLPMPSREKEAAYG